MVTVHDDGVIRGEQRALVAKLGLCQRQLRFETSAKVELVLLPLCVVRSGRTPSV